MSASGQQPGAPLYERLGGYGPIAAIIDDFLERMRVDPLFARFRGGRSLDSIRRSRQLIVDQLCVLSGGPCVYIGRDMKTSHGGLGITVAEWEASLRHVNAALVRLKVPSQEQAEFVALFERYRDEIVEK